MSTPKICPLIGAGNPIHMAKCRKEGCAWWNEKAAQCAVTIAVDSFIGTEISQDSAANGIWEIAGNLDALLFTAEQKKAPGSADNTDRGNAEQNLTETVSASDCT